MEIKKLELIKYILIVLFVTVVFAIDVGKPRAETIKNYNNIEMSEVEYNRLVNLGFTEDEIYHMDQKTFDLNKDVDAKLLAKTVKHYKIVHPTYGNSYTVEVTEDEIENAEQNHELRGSTYDYYKTVISTISANGGNSYRYKVSTTWTNFPSNRSYDIIGVGFTGGTVSISSTVYFFYRWADANGNYTTSYTYANRKSVSTGGAAVYHLPSGTLTSLGATLYYDVTRNTTSTISMCGDYAHATATVSSSNVSDYNIGIGGIGLGPSLAGYYDAIPCAMSYAS